MQTARCPLSRSLRRLVGLDIERCMLCLIFRGNVCDWGLTAVYIVHARNQETGNVCNTHNLLLHMPDLWDKQVKDDKAVRAVIACSRAISYEGKGYNACQSPTCFALTSFLHAAGLS